jgi:hypothetical protein
MMMVMVMMTMIMIATIMTVATKITKKVTKIRMMIIIIIITLNYAASGIASDLYSIIFGSKLGCDTDHHFRGTSPSLGENSGVIHQIRPLRLHFIFPANHD